MARPDFIQPVQLEGTTTSAREQFYGDLAQRLKSFTSQYAQFAARKVDVEGEKQGLVEALGGKRELREGSSIYDQAYNRGALQVLSAETELDIMQSIPDIESRAFDGHELSPVEWFDAQAKGTRDGLLKDLPAELVPETEVLWEKLASASRGRIAARQHGEARADGIKAIDDVLDMYAQKASKALIDGDEDAMEFYSARVEGELEKAAENFLFDDDPEKNSEQVIKRSEAFFAQMEEAEILGGLDAAFDEGSAIGYIRKFHETVPVGMTSERHSELWGNLLTRHGRLTKYMEDAEVQAEKEQEDIWDENQRLTRVAILRGEEVDLAQLVEDNMIREGWADSAEKRAKHVGPIVDNELVQAYYKIDLGFYSYEEIMDEEELTYDTRIALVEAKAELEADQANWMNSDPAIEGRRRIMFEIGINEGVPRPGISNKMMREANAARTRWYNAVEELPLELREGKALELADIEVVKAKALRAEERIPDELTILAGYKDEMREMAKFGEDSERYRDALRKVQNKEDDIAALEKVVQRGR